MVARGARRVARRAITGACAVALLTAAVRPATAHPLHTSLTELTYDAATGAVAISIRVFADDFVGAVARRAGAAGTPSDSAILRYVVERLVVADRGGRAMPLAWCGTRRAGEMMFVCLRSAAAGSPSGASVRSALLTERFPDQINIVQASYGGRRETLLFTRGGGAKTLP